jgi:ArsR family transcriptional regulator, arsenate/arsenite/antimonite-responsive transcriptional repressor
MPPMTSPRTRVSTMQTTQAIDALGALAQDTRLKIFRLLVQRGPEGLTAGVIAERLAVPPATLSFHLQQLMHAGLIQQRRASRSLIYSANFDTMHALLAYLTENCCSEAPASCAPTGVSGCDRAADAESTPRPVHRAGGRR